MTGAVAATLHLPRSSTPLEGTLLRLDGEFVEGVFPRAFAPGAPFTVRLTLSDTPVGFTAKAVGSKRREEGDFRVRMRMLDVRKSVRAGLAAALG